MSDFLGALVSNFPFFFKHDIGIFSHIHKYQVMKKKLNYMFQASIYTKMPILLEKIIDLLNI